MILDRVIYQGNRGETAVSGAVYDGIRSNRDGMTCIAFKQGGATRATLVELGLLIRIEAAGRAFAPKGHSTWKERRAEVEAFFALSQEAPRPAARAPDADASPIERPPWWRRIFS